MPILSTDKPLRQKVMRIRDINPAIVRLCHLSVIRSENLVNNKNIIVVLTYEVKKLSANPIEGIKLAACV